MSKLNLGKYFTNLIERVDKDEQIIEYKDFQQKLISEYQQKQVKNENKDLNQDQNNKKLNKQISKKQVGNKSGFDSPLRNKQKVNLQESNIDKKQFLKNSQKINSPNRQRFNKQPVNKNEKKYIQQQKGKSLQQQAEKNKKKYEKGSRQISGFDRLKMKLGFIIQKTQNQGQIASVSSYHSEQEAVKEKQTINKNLVQHKKKPLNNMKNLFSNLIQRVNNGKDIGDIELQENQKKIDESKHDKLKSNQNVVSYQNPTKNRQLQRTPTKQTRQKRQYDTFDKNFRTLDDQRASKSLRNKQKQSPYNNYYKPTQKNEEKGKNSINKKIKTNPSYQNQFINDRSLQAPTLLKSIHKKSQFPAIQTHKTQPKIVKYKGTGVRLDYPPMQFRLPEINKIQNSPKIEYTNPKNFDIIDQRIEEFNKNLSTRIDIQQKTVPVNHQRYEKQQMKQHKLQSIKINPTVLQKSLDQALSKERHQFLKRGDKNITAQQIEFSPTLRNKLNRLRGQGY